MAKKVGNSLRVEKPYTKVPNGLWLSAEFNEMSAHAQSLYPKFLARWNPYESDQPFAFPYAYVKETCYYCKHKETVYREVRGTIDKIVDNRIYIRLGSGWEVISRHKNRILYVKSCKE